MGLRLHTEPNALKGAENGIPARFPQEGPFRPVDSGLFHVSLLALAPPDSRQFTRAFTSVCSRISFPLFSYMYNQ